METDNLNNKIRNATVLSGIGMGLLLGLIMGLSVSEVVKLIMGTLTAMLGVFLGFDKKSFAGMSNEEYEKDSQNAYFTALRAGWFGIMVVLGLLLGMFIRTNNLFSLTIKDNVKSFTDAGFDEKYARELVLFQRLGIHPTEGGQLGTKSEDLAAASTVGTSSNLFHAEQSAAICGRIDADLWSNDWNKAKEAINEIEEGIPLQKLLEALEINVPENQRFNYLYANQTLICFMGKGKTEFSLLGANLPAWNKNEHTKPIADLISMLPTDKQGIMIAAYHTMITELEKKK